uniref:ubiquitin domain-containing protein 1 n=1 Tax=Ciona intestinalis TaxID=7719 RepID=UPI0000521998|nr:ubiquitin domain-containing protein 1 [Ciona intestinalis]|eukprot:XP_002119609.1 ubiquitin domain-containing protein 1 [Ciona intestinalis]
MGACLGTNRGRHEHRHSNSRHPGTGTWKNQTLRKEHPKWRSDVPLTEGQLRSKRDEFWDTAPAFDGRKEIWDALKAAAAALESGDNTLAQAIIDGANISLPQGTMLDCYDELGALYQVPVYCLSPPVNLIRGVTASQSRVEEELVEIKPGDKSFPIKVRLRGEKEIRLKVLPNDSVLNSKRRLEAQESIAVSKQRWFFSGKMMSDSVHLQQYKLEKGYVIQCVVREQDD